MSQNSTADFKSNFAGKRVTPEMQNQLRAYEGMFEKPLF
jgi:hypothetical protein